MSQTLVFRLVLGSVAAVLIGFQFLIYRRWRARVSAEPGRRSGQWVLALFAGLALTCSAYLLLFVVVGRGVIPEVLSGPGRVFYYVFLSWHYGFAVALPVWLFFTAVVALLSKGMEFLLWRSRRAHAAVQDEGLLSARVTRKSLLLSVASVAVDAIPVGGAAANLGGMLLGSRDIEVFRREIVIPRLHPDLQGLRIVQVSDLHIGPLIHETYLGVAAQMIAALRPDAVVITGDIIDNDNRYLPVAGLFLRRLLECSRHGVFVVSGNHDFIDDGEEALAAFARVGRSPVSGVSGQGVGVTVLRNTMSVLQRGAGALQFVGLDYPTIGGRPRALDRLAVSQDYFRAASAPTRREWPTVVLNHHPGDFVYLRNEEVDLVLSGHMHGGQVLFSTDRDSPLALASNVASYYIDLYEENGRQLYVNRGLGHWFPLRVQCPPEITLLTLS